ncbi:MAG: MFS transporter [Rhizomicrobium sp.]
MDANTENATSAAAQPDGADLGPARAYRGYILALVLVGFALNFVDRQIVSVLLQPIKNDLHLSDSALGFLSGLAFALFYATLGLPIARQTDKGSRRIIMSLSIAVWSLMTTLCGFVQNTAQLLLARFGVGIGEAGFTPAAMSILADYFPKEKRATAFAIANIGPMLGLLLGFLIGSVALRYIGWRGAFMIAGAPGLLFAAVFFLTVREPSRGMSDGVSPAPQSPPPLIRSLPVLWNIRAYRFLMFACASFSFCSVGLSTWIPSFFVRSYGYLPANIALILAPILGIGGALGIFLGGYFADRLSRRDARWALWLPACAALIALPAAALTFVIHQPVVALALYGFTYFLASSYVAPAFSTIQVLVPLNVRATATALVLFAVNLIGLGLGPQVVGILSDALTHRLGPEALRMALALSSILFVLPVLLFWAASRHLRPQATTLETSADAAAKTTFGP